MRTNVGDLDSRFKKIDDRFKRIDHLDGAPHIKPAIKATPEGLEKEIWIKANLLTEGIRFDESALEGICSVYKEQSRWLFDWNMGDHHYYLPEELLLPMDTTCQVRENRNSPWVCTVEDGVLMLKQDGKFVIEARHIPRPKYYGLEASEGVIMRRIAPKRGQDCLVLNYAPFCMYWATNDGCFFCNIFYIVPDYYCLKLTHKCSCQLPSFREKLKAYICRLAVSLLYKNPNIFIIYFHN